MAMTLTSPKTEPTLGEPASAPAPTSTSEPVLVVPASNPAPTASATPGPTMTATLDAAAETKSRLDQLSRVEDKTARIEEKFARSEERMMRVESALEKATIRLEGATQDMNLQGLKDDIARMREDIRDKPGTATIFVVALVAALIGAAAAFALTRYGIPGVIPGLLPR